MKEIKFVVLGVSADESMNKTVFGLISDQLNNGWEFNGFDVVERSGDELTNMQTVYIAVCLMREVANPAVKAKKEDA